MRWEGKLRPDCKEFSLHVLISSRNFKDKLLPSIEILKGFKQGMIEFYFHFRKLIIAVLYRVWRKQEQGN